MKRADGYKADDGTWFATAAECKQHEELAGLKLLCGLKEIDIISAINRTSVPLADAIERIGNVIADKRRKGGEMRRAKSGHKIIKGLEEAIDHASATTAG